MDMTHNKYGIIKENYKTVGGLTMLAEGKMKMKLRYIQHWPRHRDKLVSRDLHINLNMKILKLTLQNGKTREIPSFLGKLGQNENFEINAIKWQDPSYPELSRQARTQLVFEN